MPTKSAFTDKEWIAILRDGRRHGESGRSIARRFKVDPSTVSRNRRRLEFEGALKPKTQPLPLPHRIGSLRPQLQNLPPEVWEWLHQQMPEGSTYNEFLLGCMIDAYYEDESQKEPTK